MTLTEIQKAKACRCRVKAQGTDLLRRVKRIQPDDSTIDKSSSMINPGTGFAWLRSHAYSEDGIVITDYSHMMERHRFF